MAREYKEVPYSGTRRELASVTCDVCGRVGKDACWETCKYEVNETELKVTVHQKEGEHWPGEAWGTEVVIDMCPQCFKEKLIPWVESFGQVKVKEEDWSY